MRTPLIRAGAGMVTAVMLLLVALPLTAAAATATVSNGDEAWFLAKKEFLKENPTGEDPTCSLPTDCNVSGQATRPAGHPENVLVVAANAGDPDAQTYFNFDTLALPFGAQVTGGTVTLPVAKDPDARNARPSEAKMVACLVTGFIPGGGDGGSYADRPKWDKNVCVPVKQAKPEPDLTFTVDLERFGKEWASGTMMNGITLLMDPAIEQPAPNETWRVVFNTKRRAEQETAKQEEQEQPEESRIEYPAITSKLEYKVAKNTFPPLDDGGTDSGFDTGGGSTFPPPDSGGTDPGFTDTGTTTTESFDAGTSSAPVDSGVIAPPDSSVAPPVSTDTAAEPPLAAAPPAAAPPTVAAAATGPSIAVWLAPLIALALAGAMAWSLMQPVELAGAREGAVSRLMRTRRLNAANPS